MVNFAVPFLIVDFKNSKCESMLGLVRRILPEMIMYGGCSSVFLNLASFAYCGAARSTPSKPCRKSMCHQSRRNSPSVIDCRPTSSCSLTTSRMCRSSACFSASADISPVLRFARASCSALGRSRLPTWSARNGAFTGKLGGLLERQRLVGRFPGEFGLLAAEVPVGRGLLVDRAQQVEHLD